VRKTDGVRDLMDETQNLGSVVRQQRKRLGLTLEELAAKSGVSMSHLGRIENAQRYPSARVLRQIAKPLNLEENGLFDLAVYLPANKLKPPDFEKPKLLAELDILVDRVTADVNRIKSIIRKLHVRS
jgi:transcriptional regulator with XRE-family HTH domain